MHVIVVRVQTEYNSVVNTSFVEKKRMKKQPESCCKVVVAENQLVACLLFKDRYGELASPDSPVADAPIALSDTRKSTEKLMEPSIDIQNEA